MKTEQQLTVLIDFSSSLLPSHWAVHKTCFWHASTFPLRSHSMSSDYCCPWPIFSIFMISVPFRGFSPLRNSIAHPCSVLSSICNLLPSVIWFALTAMALQSVLQCKLHWQLERLDCLIRKVGGTGTPRSCSAGSRVRQKAQLPLWRAVTERHRRLLLQKSSCRNPCQTMGNILLASRASLKTLALMISTCTKRPWFSKAETYTWTSSSLSDQIFQLSSH